MKKALIVIDLQNDYFEGGAFPLWNSDQTLSNVTQAITKAQEKGMPVILIQHIADSSQGIAPFFNEGTEGVKIHPQILEATKAKLIVTKAYADSFHNTDLQKVLNDHNITELLICGMMTQNCVTHTAISKVAEHYEVKILTDCCTSVSEPIHYIALHALSTRVNFLTLKNDF